MFALFLRFLFAFASSASLTVAVVVVPAFLLLTPAFPLIATASCEEGRRRFLLHASILTLLLIRFRPLLRMLLLLFVVEIHLRRLIAARAVVWTLHDLIMKLHKVHFLFLIIVHRLLFLLLLFRFWLWALFLLYWTVRLLIDLIILIEIILLIIILIAHIEHIWHHALMPLRQWVRLVRVLPILLTSFVLLFVPSGAVLREENVSVVALHFHLLYWPDDVCRGPTAVQLGFVIAAMVNFGRGPRWICYNTALLFFFADLINRLCFLHVRPGLRHVWWRRVLTRLLISSEIQPLIRSHKMAIRGLIHARILHEKSQVLLV